MTRTRILFKPNDGAQTAFAASTAREVMFGGAVRGGKTEMLIHFPMYRIHHPLHRSIILRRTRPQQQEIVDRTRAIYPLIDPGAEWKEGESRWVWSSGAVTYIGFAEHEKDIQKFKTFEFDMVLFDELTTFTQYMYTFMFSRNRTKSADLPPIMRSGSNPDGEGSLWVFERFVSGKVPFKIDEFTDKIITPKGEELSVSLTRQFIPATIWDNPNAPDQEKYIAGILQMGPEVAAQLLYGQWGMTESAMFKKMPLVVPAQLMKNDYYVVRAMDYGWGDFTVVYHAVVYPDDTVDIVSEIYIRETPLDGIIMEIKQREKALGLREPIFSVGSPDMFRKQATSGKSIGTIMTEKGVWIQEAKTDRVIGWAQVINFLSRNQIRVWEDRAPNLLRTLPHMKRDPLKPNDLAKYQEDHSADTLRYLIMAVHERPKDQKPAPVVQLPNEQYRDQAFDRIIEDLKSQRERAIFPELGQW